MSSSSSSSQNFIREVQEIKQSVSQSFNVSHIATNYYNNEPIINEQTDGLHVVSGHIITCFIVCMYERRQSFDLLMESIPYTEPVVNAYNYHMKAVYDAVFSSTGERLRYRQSMSPNDYMTAYWGNHYGSYWHIHAFFNTIMERFNAAISTTSERKACQLLQPIIELLVALDVLIESWADATREAVGGNVSVIDDLIPYKATRACACATTEAVGVLNRFLFGYFTNEHVITTEANETLTKERIMYNITNAYVFVHMFLSPGFVDARMGYKTVWRLHYDKRRIAKIWRKLTLNAH